MHSMQDLIKGADSTPPLTEPTIMNRKTRRRPTPASPAGDAKAKGAKPSATVPANVEPVTVKIGEPRGNLAARAAAFLRRRGLTKS